MVVGAGPDAAWTGAELWVRAVEDGAASGADCTRVDGIGVAHFDERDVVRHPLVARIVAAYGRADDARGARDRAEAGLAGEVVEHLAGGELTVTVWAGIKQVARLPRRRAA